MTELPDLRRQALARAAQRGPARPRRRPPSPCVHAFRAAVAEAPTAPPSPTSTGGSATARPTSSPTGRRPSRRARPGARRPGRDHAAEHPALRARAARRVEGGRDRRPGQPDVQGGRGRPRPAGRRGDRAGLLRPRLGVVSARRRPPTRPYGSRSPPASWTSRRRDDARVLASSGCRGPRGRRRPGGRRPRRARAPPKAATHAPPTSR